MSENQITEEALKIKIKTLENEVQQLKEIRQQERKSMLDLYSNISNLFLFDEEKIVFKEQIISATKEINTPNYKNIVSLVENNLLKNITNVAKTIDFSISTIENSINSLDSSIEIHDKLKNSLNNYNRDHKGYGIDSKQTKLLKILEIYNVAFNEFVSKNSSTKECYSKDQSEQLCASIQQLITEMDFSSSVSDELTLLRYKLLSDVPIEELPKICVKIIELLVASYKLERDESQTFLTTLNNSLNLFNTKFTSSIAIAKDIQSIQLESNASIDLAIDMISDSIGQVDTINQLKNNIVSQVANIKTAMKGHHQVQEKQSSYVKAIEKIQERLKLMVEETEEYKQKIDQQKNRLLTDSLTQLNNKNSFDERIEHEFRRWQRYGGDMSIALVDVDNFRNINEKYGHLAGDRALKVIARALQSKIRDTDFIARYSGEKFVVIFLGADLNSIESPLKKLGEVISSIPFHFKENKVAITVSIGAAYFTQNDNPVTVFDKAERALDAAKQNGKNCFKIL